MPPLTDRTGGSKSVPFGEVLNYPGFVVELNDRHVGPQRGNRVFPYDVAELAQGLIQRVDFGTAHGTGDVQNQHDGTTRLRVVGEFRLVVHAYRILDAHNCWSSFAFWLLRAAMVLAALSKVTIYGTARLLP